MAAAQAAEKHGDEWGLIWYLILILALEEINKSKRARLWESQSGMRVVKLTIWVKSFEIEKL